MARSGSASRTSRGVSSWNAAVRMPTFMNAGSNARVGTAPIVLIGIPGGDSGCTWSTGGDVDPAAALLAGEDRIEQTHLAQARVEARVVARSAGIQDRLVEAPEQLLERVAVPFGVSAGKVRIGGGAWNEKSGILWQDLVAAV